MGFEGVLISEIFHSLQGETSRTGRRFAFVRLTGCNLRCGYCDSVYAFHGGTRMSIEDVLRTIEPYAVKEVLVTGGEPLMQRQTPALVRALVDAGYEVSIETHGETSIAEVAPLARVVMDIKTPGSGMSRGGYVKNLPHLKRSDEVKFVLCDEADYHWAKERVESGEIPTEEILFSPVIEAQGSPQGLSSFSLRWLAERVLEDRLPVRVQTQLHKWIWGPDQKGV